MATTNHSAQRTISRKNGAAGASAEHRSCFAATGLVASILGVGAGLGVLPTSVTFAAEKVLGRPSDEWQGHRVEGYEIHHGVVDDDRSFPGGMRRGPVFGSIWHGTLECDDFRRALLAEVAALAGSRPRADPALFWFT